MFEEGDPLGPLDFDAPRPSTRTAGRAYVGDEKPAQEKWYLYDRANSMLTRVLLRRVFEGESSKPYSKGIF